jgi:alpha-N-arabinofuranosidase
MKPHSTEVAGYHDNPSGDMRFFNNLAARKGDLSPFNETRLPMQLDGNVFLKDAKPCSQEKNPLLEPEFDAQIQLTEKTDGFYLECSTDPAWAAVRKRKLITSEVLGTAVISGLPFQKADGSSVRVDRDYLGDARSSSNPFPGPFECPTGGKQRTKVFGKESGNKV